MFFLRHISIACVVAAVCVFSYTDRRRDDSSPDNVLVQHTHRITWSGVAARRLHL